MVSINRWKSWKDVEAKGCNDSSLLNILRCHRDLMIALEQVNFREDGFTRKLLVEIMDGLDRILVICGHGIETSVVTTDAPTATRLGGDKEG